MTTLGNLFIIAAPSGAGKTSLVKQLLAITDDVQVSISHTTRPMRPGEVEGENYFFVDDAAFDNMIEQQHFLEYADVFGHRYGTSKEWVKQQVTAGTDVILEIDWQGAQQIRQRYAKACSIFILPPSLAALQQRLHDRGQDNAEVIANRMAKAQAEMSHNAEFDYLLVNDEFSHALNQLQTILLAERLRLSRQQIKQANLLKELLA